MIIFYDIAWGGL